MSEKIWQLVMTFREADI